MKPIVGMVALVMLAGCQQRTEQKSQIVNDAQAASTDLAPPAPQANETANVSDDRTPLAEPQGPIDPKTAEAAGQVVQHYGALIEQSRFAEAAKFWSDAGAATAFTKELQSRGQRHLEIGRPGEPEGAAGSIWVTMPVVFYDGRNRSAADVILRRVNDVPGSSEAQRRWHIERIEWKT